MQFKKYLLTETRDYLSLKIGDVLTGVHELVAGGKQVGARQLVRHTEGIVNQIRKILHTSWPRTEYKYLRKLQKCGVALMKTIDEKGDLKTVLNDVRLEIESLSQKLGMPINDLGASKKKEVTPQQQQPAPQPAPEEQQQQPPPQSEQPQQLPPA